MRSNEFLVEYYDAEDNEFSNRKIDDTRRGRLTLKHLNKLRKQREVHATEYASRIESIKDIYSKPAAE